MDDVSLTVPSFTAVDGTVASFFALVFSTMTNHSFVGCQDPADTACYETDFASFFYYVIMAKWFGDGNLFNNTAAFTYIEEEETISAALGETVHPGFDKLFPGKDLPLPAIRLRALDAAGNGVPGLRVRLNVFDSIYPNMPPVARVVTCSLLKGRDGEDEAEKVVPIDGMAPNEVAEMKRDGQLVCETDKDGYVNMRVKHPLITSFAPPGGGSEEGEEGEEGGRKEPIELNMPEYIESSSSGTIFYEYAAYRPIYETVTNRTGGKWKALAKLERACSIDLQMDVKSRVATVEWDREDARMTDPLEQQRTAFNIITAEGALEENPNPEYSEPTEGNPFDDLKRGNTISLQTKESDNVTISGATDLDAMFDKDANIFLFDVKDENGIGVK